MVNIKSLFNFFLVYIERLAGCWWGWLFLIAWPVLFVYAAVFLSGLVFFNNDIFNFYAVIFNYSKSLHNNLGIFLNPFILSGFPDFAASSLFSPIYFIFFRLFYFLTAYHWLLALNLILGGFFMTAFLREFKIHNLAAVIGGLAWVISIQSIDLPVVNGLPLLPFICWMIVWFFRSRSFWPIVWGGVAIGMGCLSVHYNWLFIILTGGFIFALSLPWIFNQSSEKKYFNSVGGYSAMGVIGFFIGLVQFFPAIVYSQLSSRWGGMAYGQSAGGIVSFFDLFSLIFPSFELPYLTQSPFLYFGILPLVLLIVAFSIKSRPARFFTFLVILITIMVVPYSPLFFVIQKLPIFEYFRVPARWMFLGLFAASALAGFGADKLMVLENLKTRKIILKIFGWLILIISFCSIVSNTVYYFFGNRILGWLENYFKNNFYSKTTQLPIEHYNQVIKDLFEVIMGLLSFGNLKFVLPFVVLVLSYFFWRYFLKYQDKTKYFLPAAVLMIGFNFIIVFPFDAANISVIKKEVFSYQSEVAKFIRQNEGRVFSFMPGFSEWHELTVPHKPKPEDTFIFESELMAPKINVFSGIRSADGFDSMEPNKYAKIVALLGSDRAVSGEKLSDLKITLAEKIKLFQERHNLLDMLAVKYVISSYNLEDKNLKKVFETLATRYQIPVYVYENIDSPSLIFWAENIKYLNPSDDNYKIIIERSNNFKDKNFIECVDCPIIEANKEIGVNINKYDNGYIKIIASIPQEAWLVFNEQNLPGWRATIDGKEVKIYTANYVFQAVLVPAGQHEIIFDYRYSEVIKFLFKK